MSVQRFAVFLSTFGLLVSDAAAECSFCPKEVTLSEDLAGCYLEILDNELDTAEELNLDVHLVNLSVCADAGGTRSIGMPEPKSNSSDSAAVDTNFLISVVAMECLAQTLQVAVFETEDPKTFEVRNDCQK